jgi:phage anti-repressor protein
MYKEHYQDFKTGNKRLSFARHLIENNLQVVFAKSVHMIKKDGHTNTLEERYIYNEKKNDNHIKVEVQF